MRLSMLGHGRVAGLVWSAVAVALSAGCAAPRTAISPAVMDGGAPMDQLRR